MYYYVVGDLFRELPNSHKRLLYYEVRVEYSLHIDCGRFKCDATDPVLFISPYIEI